MSQHPSGGGSDARAAEAAGLLAFFERELVGRRGPYAGGDQVWVESARLDGGFPATELVLVLRRASRPGCAYAFKARVWDDDGRLMGTDEAWDTVEDYAGILAIHLDEIVHAGMGGLPDDCHDGEVTWPVDRLGGTYWGRGTDLPRFPPLEAGDILLLRPASLARVLETMADGRIRAEVWDHARGRAVERLVDPAEVEKSLGGQLGRAADTPALTPEARAMRAWLDRGAQHG